MAVYSCVQSLTVKYMTPQYGITTYSHHTPAFRMRNPPLDDIKLTESGLEEFCSPFMSLWGLVWLIKQGK